ncbi:MAG: hypothetical protein RBQ94_03085 [Methanimicrococcus sp.]|nr:hypothetical protein [Methanimicrococcus sp.]
MNSKIKIILCAGFIFLFLISSGCLTDFKENVDSGFKNKTENSDHNEFHSRGFSNIISNEDVVAYFGDDPRIYELNPEADRLYDGIALSIKNDAALKSYSDAGIVTGYSGNGYGYITIFVNPEISSEEIEAIRSIVEEYGKKSGITNIPIVFSSSSLYDPASEVQRYRIVDGQIQYLEDDERPGN